MFAMVKENMKYQTLIIYHIIHHFNSHAEEQRIFHSHAEEQGSLCAMEVYYPHNDISKFI